MAATKIGLLYSIETGIVLRTINPDNIMGDDHLDWLNKNLPDGTALHTLLKSEVGADELNCPNLDFLIPHVKKNHGITLNFGKSCSVVDHNNIVISNVMACPVLHQKTLNNRAIKAGHKPHLLVHHINGEVGDEYDLDNKVFKSKKRFEKIT